MLSARLYFAALLCLFVSESCHGRDRRETLSEDDECNKPLPKRTPGQRPTECCKMIELYEPEALKKCHENVKQHTSSSQTKPAPGPDVGCIWECVYNSTGLLLAKTNTLDREAFAKHINNISLSFPDWSSTLTAGATKCYDIAGYNGTDANDCKSGAFEFSTCFYRQLFLNCARSAWSSSDECLEMKVRVEKCSPMFQSTALLKQRTQ